MGLRRADVGGPADKKLTHVCGNTLTHVRVQRQQKHSYTRPCTASQQKHSYTLVRVVKERETIGRFLWVWAGRNIFCFSGPNISSLQQWSMQ